MTEFEHTLVAMIILQLLWHLFLKQHFITKENSNEWEKVIKDFFLSK
jgi:predicted AlkP superfamily phosphohydrolase/phosphomutase